ncbi:MAG: Gfo/Idh/MocA family oxidoreductase [Sedimentisphaerales bacterium]|nr:Gfo/Idh/MocA family oxidoreductase [Sedimentisphaerales bacterium]
MKKKFVFPVLLALLAATPCSAQGQKILRLGMIGLDTSHVIAFTEAINAKTNEHGCKVVAGYPGGSPDVASSANRVEGFTQQLREKYGLEIVDSIEQLCGKVDGVLLESVDGRPHLKQAGPVIKAGLPLFIDKPMAGSLADVIEIFRLAKQANVPCWSSSSLRYTPGAVDARSNADTGAVLGCDAYGPCSLEAHHPDLYWYGVHGVEMLFTVMGPGCKSVSRTQAKDFELVTGVWKDGRIGTFRGIRRGKSGYGATIFCEKQIVMAGEYPGYGPLVDEIIKFFKTGKIPVPAEETIEIFAFMSAADESKASGGMPVSIQELMEKARLKADPKKDNEK